MLEKYLQDIGLTENESLLYLALLQVEGYTALDISKKTKINRSTVYVTIEALSKKGLVSEITVGKKTQFKAEPPERIKSYLERRKIEIEEMTNRVDDIIPQIKSITRELGERPIVKYFEGKEGIVSANDELFANMENDAGITYLIYPKDIVEEVFTDKEREKYRTIRLSKNIKSKVIYTSAKGDRPSDSTGDRIKIDHDKYPISCDISIYEDNVRISILGKHLSGIFIKSKDFAETLKSLFKLSFDNLK